MSSSETEPFPSWIYRAIEESPVFKKKHNWALLPYYITTTEPPSLVKVLESAPPSIPETTLGLKSIRYLLFTAYKRVFGLIFITNLIAFIVVAARSLSLTAVINAASANVAINAIARQEFFINGIFRLVVLIPLSAPLSIRRVAAKIFHYGGLHSGCGVASLVWFVLFVGRATYAFIHGDKHGNITVSTVVITYVLLIVLTTIITLAHPNLRIRHHDRFDHGHRVLAWVALSLFWALLLMACETLRQEEPMGKFLLKFPTFWFTIVATVCTISPWIWVRHVDVCPEKLSNHAIQLHFTHRKPGRVVGIKLATKLTGDWHSFAVFPDDDGQSFSALVSNAGDWTKACIQSQPTKLWTRGYPLHGAAYVGAMFRSLVVVATGSGIGPIMGLLMSKQCPPSRVLWQTRNVRNTYGQKLLDRIRQADSEAVIIDTDIEGRKDMLTLSWNMVMKSGAEAVFIVSNPKVTQQVVFGLEARGIPAYGPIFDS